MCVHMCVMLGEGRGGVSSGLSGVVLVTSHARRTPHVTGGVACELCCFALCYLAQCLHAADPRELRVCWGGTGCVAAACAPVRRGWRVCAQLDWRRRRGCPDTVLPHLLLHVPACVRRAGGGVASRTSGTLPRSCMFVVLWFCRVDAVMCPLARCGHADRFGACTTA